MATFASPVMRNLPGIIAALLVVTLVAATRAGEPIGNVDMLVFGSADSEQAHSLKTDHSEITKGALDEPARKLLPGGGEPWEGGRASLTMKVDPQKQTYLTARFWGDELDKNLLLLFCEGKQVGYRHLGDIDILALPDEEPRYNGRFYYVTTPLPPAMTKGKSEVHLEIRATGPIWGYGNNFDQYQKPMTTPERNMYRLYTHTDGCFVPPVDEKQGDAPLAVKRTEPGAELLDKVKDRVNGTLARMLKSAKPLNQMEVQFLAKAYFVKWTVAHDQKAVIEQVIKGVDQLYKRWKKDPEELWKDGATWNPLWFGVGPAGDAVRLLAKPLESSLDIKIDGATTRRAAWSAMLQASRDWLRAHRRFITNQTMFTDVNLYLSNRAVAAIDPAHAMAEGKALDYLYQAVGLVPWLGSDTDHGPERIFGDDYRQVTEKGLTRELGYVGSYGEVGAGGAMEIYESTRVPGGEGDPKIKAQLAKILRARAVFRYPMLDEENHPAMRLETGVGWRDVHFPGSVIYVQPPGGEGSTLRSTAATMDPYLIGYVQQMFADNQFFASVATHLKDGRFRSTVGLLGLPDEYDLLQAQPPSPHRLPMSWDQPDFVFSDEEDGVVAIKHGQEILFVSLYWRAHYAVNFLARTHYLTPHYQQVAVVREDVAYEPNGTTYKRPDWINFGFGNGGKHIHYPPDLHQAYAGQELPIAKIPAGVKYKPNDPNDFAGRGEFYTLRYGPYLIGMNMTKAKSFELKVPEGAKSVEELVSNHRNLVGGTLETVGPRSTAVIYLGQ
jgi:hypothetical protein